MGKAPWGAVHSKTPFLFIGGGYLLSHFRSTIGVAGFNFSVRNGKRWSPRAIATLVRRAGKWSGRSPGLAVGFPPCKVGKRAVWKRADCAACEHSLSLVDTRRIQAVGDSCRPLASGSCICYWGTCVPERVWVISTARLWRCRLYTCGLSTSWSATTLVWKSYLGEGFVLRCFQHLSLPDAATRRCTWRYNRNTGGLSNTVLSY